MTTVEETTLACEFAQRQTIAVYRVSASHILIVATGEVPTPGHQVKIEQSPLRIFPPQFNLVLCRRPGTWAQVVTPYTVARFFNYPSEATEVVVHHGEGRDEVPIEPLVSGADQVAAIAPASEDEALGLSEYFSFDEAFRDALANLPDEPVGHPDQLTQVTVTESGALFGGIAGFNHFFVRVSRTRI